MRLNLIPSDGNGVYYYFYYSLIQISALVDLNLFYLLYFSLQVKIVPDAKLIELLGEDTAKLIFDGDNSSIFEGKFEGVSRPQNKTPSVKGSLDRVQTPKSTKPLRGPGPSSTRSSSSFGSTGELDHPSDDWKDTTVSK